MKKILFTLIFLLIVLSSCKLKEDTTGSTDVITETSIKVVVPNGGESLPEGSAYQIQWTGTGTTYVRIQYSVDNGTTWSLVADSVKINGFYNWQPIPNVISNQCKIRISTLDGQYLDESDKVFAIIRNSNKSLRIISPVGKESWEAGSQQKIKWFSSGIDSVRIEFTTNNGLIWSQIIVDKKNTGIYTWEPVPNTPSILAKIRITDAKETVLPTTTESPEPFEILPERIIRIISPNGGEQLVSGSSKKIEYISENIEKVKIAYTTNNGFNWNTIIESVQANGFYNWVPIPVLDSKLCKVRVYNANGGSPSDYSDSVFTITSSALKTITLISPKGGESWQAGTNQSLTWNSTSIQKVKIEFSTNNGLTWNNIVDQLNNTGVYDWLVPNAIASQCLIRISDASDQAISDQTKLAFKITSKPEIKVLAPNGGENITEGSSYEIKWIGSGTNMVKIAFTSDNGSTWYQIVDSLKNTGIYNWFPVPNSISTQCKIRVFSVDGVSSDESDNLFSITRNSNESLKLNSPTGEEAWEAGTSKQIKWYSSGIDSVKIEYTTNNGGKWNLIAVDKKNTGVFYWEPIPNTPSTLARVRILDAKDGIPSSESGIFSILPEPILKVLSPNGGETILAKTNRKIEWLSENIEKVNIALTTNNGFTWVSIQNLVPSTGFYIWTVDSTINSQLCKIRIYDSKDGEPNDVSDNTFTITNQVSQTLEVTSPNGGEKWQAGTNQSITWRSTGVSKVKIEFTSNNGLTWNSIVDQLQNTGAYEWNIPNSISTQCLIKISDGADGEPVDQSNGNFRIVPKPELRILKPNGGENWVAGISDTIKWSSVGVENVTLEYTPNNGSTWFTIVEKTPSSGSYITSFSAAGTLYKIRITDKENGSPQDESDGTFTVTAEPKITVISPNGNEEWYAGSSNNITWKSTNIENVKIEYTINNGATWNIITNSTPSNGVYSWNPIPIISSLQCRIRVSDATDGIPSDVSDENFAVTHPGTQLIKVTKPNGGERWPLGTPQEITWDAAGLANVKIEYTINNGVNWTLITASTPSTGYYTWTQVPNTPATNCKIRISDAVDSSPSDESDQFFTIGTAPSLKVLTPNGNDTWLSGLTKEIRWSSENVANVKIEYTVDGGATWKEITNSVQSTGSYFWTNIPEVNSLQCKIKISDAQFGTPSDISDDNFAIMKPGDQQIKVKSPNGGETWYTGSPQNITWDAGGIANVKIEYTSNNGLNWTTVIASTPSNGLYTWNPIPNTPATNCKIRISDALDGDPVDVSDNLFSILVTPTIKVVAPNGGETIQTGVPTEIKWTSENVENVKIEYTTNGGAVWNEITNSVESTGSYLWISVPNTNSLQCRIRISDVSNGASSDISDNNFTITNQITKTIEITSPNGGEKWQAGTSQTLIWRSSGVAKVKIRFSSDNGLNWITLVDQLKNTGAYPWNVIDKPSTQCLIEVRDADDDNLYDQSNGIFRIVPTPKLIIQKPNGGETWVAGIVDTIKWDSNGVENVTLEYTPNNGTSWYTIVEKTPSNGSYVTSFTSPSSLYKIRITDKENGSPQDESDGTFTVSPEPKITVMSPNGNEEWYAGSSNNIRWNSTNIENVKIEYTTNNGASWNIITSSTPSDGVYSWSPIPIVSSTQCRIRISDAIDGVPSDITDENFTITSLGVQLISVKSPNGGESWPAGSTQSITWEASGITNVKIEYTVNNGINWNVITASTPSTGFYTWNQVPNIPSTNCKIRISDATDSSPSDESDAFFAIGAAASVRVLVPNGNDTWIKGTNREIKWTSENVVNVKIEYTTNAGGTWITIINSTPSTGSFMWNNIPDANNSLQCRIRVSEAVYGIPSDLSDDNFAIMSPGAQQIKVVSPNGNETWNVGSMQNIIWDAGGIANVKIEFTTNNGLNWSTVIASTPSNGYYTWNPIPNTPATNCKVRISDAADGDPIDMSDNSFSVLPTPTIKVISPNGGETIQTGAPTEIQWTSENVENVKIEYTTNGGANWNVIINSIESTGSYQWKTVPNTNSLQCRIRISDASNGTSSDISDNNFTITNVVNKSVKIISPNGGENWEAGTIQNITWTSSAIKSVKIELTTDKGFNWSVLVDSLTGGAYQWHVAENLNSNQCQIRVSDAKDGTISDISDGTFTISPKKFIKVTSPRGPTIYKDSDPIEIVWESSGIQYVGIKYTTTNGAGHYPDTPQFYNLVGKIANTGSYTTSFSFPSEQYYVVVYNAEEGANESPSARNIGSFTIIQTPAQKITVISPNGGEQWLSYPLLNTYEIKWNANNTENVKIEYSINGGFSWKTITSSTPNDGILSWTPSTNDSTDNCYIKISDAANSSVSDISDNPFSLHRNRWLRIDYPNKGEDFYKWSGDPGQQNMAIGWTSYAVSAVDIYVSVDNGVTWNTLILNYRSTGVFVWSDFDTYPISKLCRIKIVDHNHSDVSDVNDIPCWINIKKIGGD